MPQIWNKNKNMLETHFRSVNIFEKSYISGWRPENILLSLQKREPINPTHDLIPVYDVQISQI